jgi:Zn-dependent protease with chaperone function
MEPSGALLLVALVLPWLLALLLAAGSSRLADRADPRLVVRLVPAAAVATATACGFSLSVVALLLLSHAAQLARLGRWSAAALPEHAVPWAWGLSVAAAVAVLLASALTHAARVAHRLWLAEATCRDLAVRPAHAPALEALPGLAGGGSVEACTVVAADEPDAYAVPGLRGCIVVSSGMLAALTPPQRRALLAHEGSHLTHRHHLWIQATEVAAAANPLLRRLPAVVRSAGEREADLDAVRAVGDAAVAAGAIASAALARSRFRRSVPPVRELRLAATGGDVVRRVDLLLHARPPRGARAAAGALVAVTVAAVLSSGASAGLTHEHFETVQLTAALVHAPVPRGLAD